MKFPRASGILLHPTSLPGPFGIGDLGGEAFKFVDLLVEVRPDVLANTAVGTAGRRQFALFGIFGFCRKYAT